MIAAKLLKPIHQVLLIGLTLISVDFTGDQDNAFQSMLKLFERGRCLCHDMLICACSNLPCAEMRRCRCHDQLGARVTARLAS